ncbi:MAG: hypothetical protein RLZZ67_653 [Candidatus Parcubacteria bacterium]|jgi:hypothetical protein
MNPYRGDQAILAVSQLLLCLASIFLFYYERDHFNFFVLSPLLFFLLGIVFCYKKRLYAPNNRYSYFVIDGVGAVKVGSLYMVAAVLLGLLLNVFNVYLPEYLKFALYVQIAIFPLILIYGSIRFGQRSM